MGLTGHGPVVNGGATVKIRDGELIQLGKDRFERKRMGVDSG